MSYNKIGKYKHYVKFLFYVQDFVLILRIKYLAKFNGMSAKKSRVYMGTYTLGGASSATGHYAIAGLCNSGFFVLNSICLNELCGSYLRLP